MSDVDPFKHPPLYEEMQVITEKDLRAIRNGYLYSYLQELDSEERYMYRISVGVMDSLLDYLKRGKIPSREI